MNPTPTFDYSFLQKFQRSFADVNLTPEMIMFLGATAVIVVLIVLVAFLASERDRLRHYWRESLSSKDEKLEIGNILGFLSKHGVRFELYSVRRGVRAYFAEAKIHEVREKELVLRLVHGDSRPSLKRGLVLSCYFRPVSYKDRKFNSFDTIVQHVGRPLSTDVLVHVRRPARIEFLARRMHFRLKVREQNLVRGRLWCASARDGKNMLLTMRPAAVINPEKPGDAPRAQVGDISGGGVQLRVESMAGTGLRLGRDVVMQLFLYDPGVNEYRWIWVAGLVKHVGEGEGGLSEVGFQFTAYARSNGDGALTWVSLRDAAGIAGLNEMIERLRVHAKNTRVGRPSEDSASKTSVRNSGS